MEATKILIKLKMSDDSTQYRWIHFCYIDTKLHTEFVKSQMGSGETLNSLLSKWCKKDFGKDLKMETVEDLVTLKNLIKSYSKKEYPDLYSSTNTDRQGWIRVWLSNKMRGELNE